MSDLEPCPFCGNTEPGFERVGTPRQSCIVACGGCGARHESSDEGEDSGTSWNRRAQPTQAGPLKQILTDPENQPNQYGVEFLMHGPKFAFKVGAQQFTLDYEPTEPGEFEYMRDMLVHAFSTFTPDVKPAQAGQVLTPSEIGAALEECDFYETREANFYAGARWAEQSVLAKRVPQWLPIETAPQDWGVTKFDVWANDARFADCWWGKATYEQGEPGIVYQSDYDCNGPVDSYVRNATHWMPLPPPPGIVGEKGGA